MFLCLHQVNKNEWCLDIRQHEVVEAGEFKDSRGRLPSRIKGYKVIRNDYQFGMFDYIKLLENAEEIHMMQTGFLDLVNSYKMDKPKVYRHNYVRNYPAAIHSKGLNGVTGID